MADVAVLVPEASVWVAYTPPDGATFGRYIQRNPDAMRIDSIFRDTCHELLRRQRDFDTISEQFLQQGLVRDGRLHVGPEAFRVLILPEPRMLHPKTLAAVRSFVEAGSYAAIVGSLPFRTPGQGTDTTITQAAKSLLAEFPQRTLHVEQIGKLTPLTNWLNARVPNPVAWDGPEGVRLLQRQEPGRRIILIANPGKTPAQGWMTVPAPGQVSLWNPETGGIEDLGAVTAGAQTTIAVPAESARILVLESGRD
ncbi:MAG: glycosyl hydrolase [Planctomycetota bacterium]|nr:glycosyl hydrolase [Planctomycetota bacterium]